MMRRVDYSNVFGFKIKIFTKYRIVYINRILNHKLNRILNHEFINKY